MTFWILGVLAAFLTLLALRRYAFVFYAGASLAWWALWGYNLNNPPANITIGTFVYDILYYTLILVALGVFFLYFRNRGSQQGVTKISAENNEIVARTYEGEGETPQQYRERAARALHSRRYRGRK